MWREKLVLYADVNGFERVMSDNVWVDLGRKGALEYAVAKLHSVEGHSTPILQGGDSTMHVDRHGIIADAWQDLEREYMP